MQEKFVATLEIVVRKKSSHKVTVDEQWVSEKEMRDGLKWDKFPDCMRICLGGLAWTCSTDCYQYTDRTW